MDMKDYVAMTEFILFDKEAYLLSREIIELYEPETEVAMMIMFSLGVSVGRRQGRKLKKDDQG